MAYWKSKQPEWSAWLYGHQSGQNVIEVDILMSSLPRKWSETQTMMTTERQ